VKPTNEAKMPAERRGGGGGRSGFTSAGRPAGPQSSPVPSFVERRSLQKRRTDAGRSPGTRRRRRQRRGVVWNGVLQAGAGIDEELAADTQQIQPSTPTSKHVQRSSAV